MNDWIIIGAGLAVSAPVLMYGLWLFLHADPKLKTRGSLFAALGYIVQSIMGAMTHQPVWASADAALAALFLYWWWNNGGGDGMKRRLKSWAAAFGPKIAPQGA